MTFMKTVVISAILGLSSTVAQADSIALTEGAGWSTFDFGAAGTAWQDNFTFTVTNTALLEVTDGYLAGDQFKVYSNNVLLGATSIPLSTTAQIGNDWNTAFANHNWSSGSWVLGPGTYDIAGITTSSPFNGGAAAIQLVAKPVPEPETYAMMVAGLGLLYVVARKKAKKNEI